MPNRDYDAEWRSGITRRLDGHDEQMDEMRNAITQLMLNSSTNKSLGEVEARVRELEKFQVKAVTVVAMTQIIIALAWAIISKLITK